MAKTLEQKKAERNKLNAEIRAAERAAKKKAAEQLLVAQTALGKRLSKALGVNTPEAVAMLGDLLDSDKVREWVAKKLAPESVDTSGRDSFASATESVNTDYSVEGVEGGGQHDYRD